MSGIDKGIRAAQLGLIVNGLLVIVKLVAGILGNAYALIADAVESSADLFSSMVVWAGLRITTRPADDDYPYGYGKAEPMAAAVVALMLLGASVGIATAAVREILTPHHMPSAFTLVVLAVVVVVKEVLSRRVSSVGREVGSTAVRADAWHHRSDALTSLAAFVGIAVARLGGPGWESADDWAALVAAGVIAVNGVLLLRPAIFDLMDRAPDPALIARVESAARAVGGVLATEKLRVRKFGVRYFVDLHVQADPTLPLRDSHGLSGRVKAAIREAVPAVWDASIHMEPFAGGGPAPAGIPSTNGEEDRVEG
ncbi:MAG: cation diffusion facilitator family transporter [Isosphaeraceae bacterium]